MARASINGRVLVVRFSAGERVFTLCGRVELPLEAVRRADSVPPMSGLRGIRRYGISVLGLLHIGRWGTGAGVRQLVAVRRGSPAVRLRVDPAATGVRFDEIVVSLPDVDRLVAAVTRGQAALR